MDWINLISICCWALKCETEIEDFFSFYFPFSFVLLTFTKNTYIIPDASTKNMVKVLSFIGSDRSSRSHNLCPSVWCKLFKSLHYSSFWVSLSYLSLSSVLHSEPKTLCLVLLPKHIFCATILVPAIATPVPEKY